MAASPSTSSHWHSITPQSRPLSLSILELTPLALTLSLTLAPVPPHTRSKKKRHRRPESEEDEDDDHPLEVNFKDLLSHGVVVSVNGQPWTRIVAHVSDADDDEEWEEEASVALDGEGVTRRRPRKARFSMSAGDAIKEGRKKREGGRLEKVEKDRAVVVVYGLSPGKEYEVELTVVGMSVDDPLVSNSVLIPPTPSRSRANSLRSRSRPRSRSNSIDEAPTDVIPTNILNPVDSQAAQLRHLIAVAHSEKEHLQFQIKEARRASQRQEAALRVEIETVKRGTEKAGGMDLRAKQKALALQEQVKQGWAGGEAADKEVLVVEGGLEDLETRLTEIKAEVESIRQEEKLAKEQEEDAREKDRRARGEEEKRLAEVVGKVEKLRTRKEKKEVEKAELEKRLEELEKQREEAERRTSTHRLSAHPSLNNLSGGYAAGPAYRPRGAQGYQPRYPSAGAPRTTPVFRPPKPTPTSSPAPSVRAQAQPFHPSHPYSYDTTLMPPQLQHRIYPPSVRPRPTPNFHPPPSVLAEQQRQSPTMLSPPAFPPLPGQRSGGGGDSKAAGPSLASIVTRAVMAPGSALAAVRPSPPSSVRSPVFVPGQPLSPSTPTTASSTPPVNSSSSSSRVSWAPPPEREKGDFPPLSPTGPWAAPASIWGVPRDPPSRQGSGDA